MLAVPIFSQPNEGHMATVTTDPDAALESSEGLESFPIPQGFNWPKGKKETRVMATFRDEGEGNICLVEMGGVKLPGYAQEEPSQEEDLNEKRDLLRSQLEDKPSREEY